MAPALTCACSVLTCPAHTTTTNETRDRKTNTRVINVLAELHRAYPTQILRGQRHLVPNPGSYFCILVMRRTGPGRLPARETAAAALLSLPQNQKYRSASHLLMKNQKHRPRVAGEGGPFYTNFSTSASEFLVPPSRSTAAPPNTLYFTKWPVLKPAHGRIS